MNAYADTSFLVSLYTPDANSSRAALWMSSFRTAMAITPFGELELTNALEQRLFRKEIIARNAQEAYRAFQHDLDAGIYSPIPMPAAAYGRARQLSRQHTATLGSRTLDILHVATALVLGAEAFCTFDTVQAKLARAAGLAVTPARRRGERPPGRHGGGSQG